MSKVSFSNPKKLAPPPGYSYVVEATGGRTIYFAGQLGVDENNKFVGPEGGVASMVIVVVQPGCEGRSAGSF